MAMDNSAIGLDFPYRPILDQLIQKQFSELNHFTVTGAPGQEAHDELYRRVR